MTHADGVGWGWVGVKDGVAVVERGNGGNMLVEVRRKKGCDIEREGLLRGV